MRTRPCTPPPPPTRRYAYEALVVNEFHGVDGFRFTAFHPPGAPEDSIPHVDVTGDQILQVLGWGRAWGEGSTSHVDVTGDQILQVQMPSPTRAPCLVSFSVSLSLLPSPSPLPLLCFSCLCLPPPSPRCTPPSPLQTLPPHPPPRPPPSPPQTFGFNLSWSWFWYDVAALATLCAAFLTATFLLLK